MQQKKRREGTLSPRSTEYQYMIKECVNYLRPSIRDIFETASYRTYHLGLTLDIIFGLKEVEEG